MKRFHNGLIKTGRVAAVAAVIGCCAAAELKIANVVIMLAAVGWLTISMIADDR